MAEVAHSSRANPTGAEDHQACGAREMPTASAIAPLLPRLLRHTYSDSICLLIKCLLRLPVGGAAAPGAAAEADAPPAGGGPAATLAGGAPALSMRAAIAGELAAGSADSGDAA